MASTTETGHAKNVATFEDLISSCKGYGETYNPAKTTLKLPALTTQLTAAGAALQTVNAAKAAYDRATNVREVAFLPLRPLTTRLVNALAVSGVSKQTLADAKSVNAKIQGRRVKAIAKPDASEATAITPKTASVSQRSYIKQVEHLAQLIAVLGTVPQYKPNEKDLQLETLNALLTDLKAKNTAVTEAATALSNARIARNQLLYANDTAILPTALEVKMYVKSVFGAASPQFKQVSALRFSRQTRD